MHGAEQFRKIAVDEIILEGAILKTMRIFQQVTRPPNTQSAALHTDGVISIPDLTVGPAVKC